ncbi:DUF5133 domain-containing protein [Streptomyces sp. B93]|uniref:DUF5133 domain-containing protein n=1 Tax=Streptomyces sp. B93 TaxID=2824875 RepID=UPI001B3670F3|nr:DUF5133 domain-containing protein [Streptomyces sp. B93]MBQ1088295.1 DUF5133 domain-containing protein [Streptomyces sp. B93]
MIIPDPKVVRELLTRYASLRIAQAEHAVPAVARELEDVSYTLCVMTGTRGIREAIAAADALLLEEARHKEKESDGEGDLSLAV